MSGPVDVSDNAFRRLVRFNLVMAALHAISGTAMVVLGNDFAIDVSTVNLNGPPGTPVSEGALQDAGSIPIAPATAGFLYLSAFFHLLWRRRSPRVSTAGSSPTTATASDGSSTRSARR